MKKIILITSLLLIHISTPAQFELVSGKSRAAKLNNKAIHKYNAEDYDGAVKLLTEAARLDPENAKIEGNIGNVYYKIATTIKGQAFSEFVDYYEFAADAYKKAIAISPSAEFYYAIGAVYYNHSNEISGRIANMLYTGNDYDKLSGMRSMRDALLYKSQPYFEKAYDILSGQEFVLTGNDLIRYKAAIQVLSFIYKKENRQDKSEEMSKKLATLN